MLYYSFDCVAEGDVLRSWNRSDVETVLEKKKMVRNSNFCYLDWIDMEN